MTVAELIRLLEKENPQMTVTLPLWSSSSDNIIVRNETATKNSSGWYNGVRDGDDSGRAHGVVHISVYPPK